MWCKVWARFFRAFCIRSIKSSWYLFLPLLLLLAAGLPAKDGDILVEAGEEILLVDLEFPEGDALSESLATTVSNTVALNLSLALDQPVRRSAFLAPTVALERSRTFMREQGLDHMIYGAVERDERGSLLVTIRAWSELHEQPLVEFEEEITELVAVFDAADEIVDRFVEELTGEQFEFATVEFENTGVEEEYVVYVDGRRVGSDLTESSIPTGTRDIAIFQPSTVGELLVHREEVEVGTDSSTTVSFELVDRDTIDEGDEEREITADDLLQGTGSLRVDLFPEDAEVFLDDTRVEAGLEGDALVLEDVPAGVYSIRTERDYYRTIQDAVVVRDGEQSVFERDLTLDRVDPAVTAGLPDPSAAVTASVALSLTQLMIGVLEPKGVPNTENPEGYIFVAPRIGHALADRPLTSAVLTAAVVGAGALQEVSFIAESESVGYTVLGLTWLGAAVYDSIGAARAASVERSDRLDRYEAEGFFGPPATAPEKRLSLRARAGGGSLAALGLDYSFIGGALTADLEAGLGHSGLGVARAPRYQVRGGVTGYPFRATDIPFQLGAGMHYGFTFAEEGSAQSLIPRVEFAAQLGRFMPSLGFQYIISGGTSPIDADANALLPSIGLRWGAL